MSSEVKEKPGIVEARKEVPFKDQEQSKDLKLSQSHPSLNEIAQIDVQNEVNSASCPDNNNATTATQDDEFLTGLRLHAVSTAFAIANVMVALDSSILATALPTISSNFKSVKDVGWYGSAYLLAQMSCQPVFGKLYRCFEPKRTYLCSLLLFGIGSILCAAAPVSAVLIFGRAVTGIAAAGLLTGSLAIFGRVVPLRYRPQGMAIFVSISNIASMLGSTLGGLLTDSVLTWRFCFWINLPLGFACVVVVSYVLDRKPHPDHKLPFLSKLHRLRLDLSSFILLTLSLTCLFLALQSGGISAPWSDPKIWGCILGFGLLGIAFVALQAYQGDEAQVNLKFIRQRTVAICYIFSFAYGLAIFTHVWLLPTYFQGVKYISASLSGVLGLSFTVPMTIFSLFTGILTTKFGYYVPFMWAGSLIYVAGSALLYKLTEASTTARYIGYQIVAGTGCGMAIQTTFIAVQVVVSSHDMAHACNMEVFFRQLGSSVAISLAENIFLSKIRGPLSSISPDLSISKTGIHGLVTISKTLPSAEQLAVKTILSSGITQAFIIPIVATSVAAVISWGMEWKKIEDEPVERPIQMT